MLFVQLMKPRADINWQECMKRSLPYKWPDVGIEVVGEYVLTATDPFYIAMFKADDISQILAADAAWGDLFEIRVYPACTMQESRDITKKWLEAAG
jgi:hypothetical protein